MNIFDRAIFEKVDKIKNEAQEQIQKLSPVPIRLVIEVPGKTAEKKDMYGIMEVIAESLGLSHEDYYSGKSRAQADLRKIAVLLTMEYLPGVRLTDIASVLAQHHSTIIHSRNAGKELLATEDERFSRNYYLAKAAVIEWFNRENNNQKLII